MASQLQDMAMKLRPLMEPATENQEKREEALALLNKMIPLDTFPSDLLNLRSGRALLLRFKAIRGDSLTEVQDAVAASREAFEALDQMDPRYGPRLGELGCILQVQFYVTKKVSDAEEAIKVMRQGLGELPPGTALHKAFQSDIEQTLQRKQLVEQVTSSTKSSQNLDLSSQSQEKEAPLKTSLKIAIQPEKNVDPHMIALQAGARASRSGGDRAQFLEAKKRFDASKATDKKALEEALWHGRQLLVLSDAPVFPGHAIEVAALLTYHWKDTKDPQDLDEAINFLQDPLSRGSIMLPWREPYLFNLKEALALKQENYPEGPQELDEVIGLGRDALKAAPSGSPFRAGIQLALWKLVALAVRHFGRASDHDESIALTHQRYEEKLGDHWDNTIKLAGVFLMQAHHGDEDAQSDKAIELLRPALLTIPDQHPQREELWNCLGELLSHRYSRQNTAGDLEQAIILGDTVLEATPRGSPHSNNVERARALRMLSAAHQALFTRSRKVQDRDKANEFLREAKEISSWDTSPDWVVDRSRLILRMPQLGQKGAPGINLDEDIEALRRLKTTTHDESIIYANILGGLSRGLAARAKMNESQSDFTEAIELAREAVGRRRRDMAGYNDLILYLGRLLFRRCKKPDCTRLGHEGIADEAMNTFLQALQGTSVSQPLSRARAGFELLKTPAILHPKYSDRAFDIAQRTMELIPMIASLPQRPEDQIDVLSKTAADSAANSAAIALLSGQGAATALQLLETGRSVVAGSVYDWQVDIANLRSSSTELADELEELSGTLSFSSKEPSVDKRSEASRKMTILQDKIRRVPGFERFRLPLSEQEQRLTAGDDTIVIVNTSVHGCDAIIVQSSGVRFIPLKAVTLEIIFKHMHLEHGNQSINKTCDVLTWLWDSIVEPILANLGFDETPTESPWPRVWWIPTGPLSFFPLHAAGHHLKRDGRTALDRVVSSYSSSVKGIFHTQRQKLRKSETSKVVLSCVSDPPGLGPLRYANDEIEEVRLACIASGLEPEQPPTTWAHTLKALARCHTFHFAGHGATGHTPLESFLCLPDWQDRALTVGDLLEMQAGKDAPFLAYLSACSTSRITDEQFNDENLHLANAFQVAGFRHVIGTMWEVNDKVCVRVAKLVYQYIGKRGLVEGDDVAVRSGLHHAMVTLRNEWVKDEQKNSNPPPRLPPPPPESEKEVKEGRGPVGAVIVKHTKMPSWIPYVHYGV